MAIALAFCFSLLILFSVKAFAETDSACFTYRLLSNEAIEIRRCHSEAAEVIVPEQIDGYTVVGIGARAFYESETLTSVLLPESVEYIGKKAFCGCECLSRLSLPRRLKRIGSRAFTCCYRLSEIHFPGSQ